MRSRRSSGSRRSCSGPATSCATSSCGCARRRTSLHAFLASLEAEPGRLEELEAELDRIAEAKRRFRLHVLRRAARARRRGARELAALEEGVDPAAAAAAALAAAEARVDELAARAARGARRCGAGVRRGGRRASCTASAWARASSCASCASATPGVTGADDAVFLVRPNAGMPFGPVAETASGGELSRIALAIAAVAGGETLVFDEIDAGIGGETANAVGRVLKRLSERAQVITITHLPQIAALADRHFRVEKVPGDPTHTRIEQLGDAERKAELERMLGGQEFLAPSDDAALRATVANAPCAAWRTSGRSSPSRITCPTGGPASAACSPTAAASRPARAGRSRRRAATSRCGRSSARGCSASQCRGNAARPRRHPGRRLSFQLVNEDITAEIELAAAEENRTTVSLAVEATWGRVRRSYATEALRRLYDLVQTGDEA